METTESEDVRFRIETKHWYGYSEPFIAKNKDKLEISVYTMTLILDEAIKKEKERIDRLINIEIENKCRKENITNEKANQDKSQQMLSWFQIIMLIGRPLWDKARKKWRVLNGYQAVLGNTNNLFYEVTFTDTPYWENYADEQLYLNVPAEKEKQKESGDKGSNNKDK